MKFKKFNFKIIKSTNDTAARIIKKTNFKFGMVVAEKQFSGRGQYGRKWISYKGNLFASFFHPFDENKFSIERVTKLNCNLVKQTLSKYIKNKDIINLELPLKYGTKISGHICQGHVDAVAKVLSIKKIEMIDISSRFKMIML